MQTDLILISHSTASRMPTPFPQENSWVHLVFCKGEAFGHINSGFSYFIVARMLRPYAGWIYR
jgi:hypothetical protein